MVLVDEIPEILLGFPFGHDVDVFRVQEIVKEFDCFESFGSLEFTLVILIAFFDKLILEFSCDFVTGDEDEHVIL